MPGCEEDAEKDDGDDALHQACVAHEHHAARVADLALHPPHVRL